MYTVTVTLTSSVVVSSSCIASIRNCFICSYACVRHYLFNHRQCWKIGISRQWRQEACEGGYSHDDDLLRLWEYRVWFLYAWFAGFNPWHLFFFVRWRRGQWWKATALHIVVDIFFTNGSRHNVFVWRKRMLRRRWISFVLIWQSDVEKRFQIAWDGRLHHPNRLLRELPFIYFCSIFSNPDTGIHGGV